MTTANPIPTTINYLQQSRLLKIEFDDNSSFEFSCEFLRVHSPSADVRGHGANDGVLQVGKENVSIEEIEPVGNYAIKLRFDDGHDTGLYSWSYLYELGQNKDKYWQEYLQALTQAGQQRAQHD